MQQFPEVTFMQVVVILFWRGCASRNQQKKISDYP